MTERCDADIAARRLGEQRRDIDIERLNRIGEPGLAKMMAAAARMATQAIVEAMWQR